MSGDFDKILQTFEAAVNKELENIKTTITSNQESIMNSISQFRSVIESEVVNIHQEISRMKKKIEHLEHQVDNFARDKRALDMTISGIPILKNCSPAELFQKICNAIQYDMNTNKIGAIFRLPQKKNSQGKAPPIIVRFHSQIHKSNFFIKYKDHSNLRLSNIGFEANSRIYCNDALTHRNLYILNNAKSLEKENKLQKAYSKKGLIYVILHNNNLPHLIRDVSELNIYINKATTTTTTNDQAIEINNLNINQNTAVVIEEKKDHEKQASTTDLISTPTAVSTETVSTNLSSTPSSFNSKINTFIDSYIDEIKSTPITLKATRTLRSNSTSSQTQQLLK